MNWKHKARLQNLIARLPSHISYDAYYLMQRTVGGLRNVKPISHLRAGVTILDAIERQGRSAEGATFLEVGTGRRVNVPIALWLAGAASVITVDLNPYLKRELVFQDLYYIKSNRDEISALFGDHAQRPGFAQRFQQLVDLPLISLDQVCAAMQIDYRAPADATSLALPPAAVDVQISYNVLEHIPPDVLHAILREGRRVLKPDGLLVHLIDPSDHFAHADPTISAINFLQFSDSEWEQYAGNRYMYHNRLRVDDYAAIFAEAGLHILEQQVSLDERALAELQSGFPLHEQFTGKSPEANATTAVDIVATPRDAAEQAQAG